jgi:hypothetical protein
MTVQTRRLLQQLLLQELVHKPKLKNTLWVFFNFAILLGMDYYREIERLHKEDALQSQVRFGDINRFSGVLVALFYAAVYFPAREFNSFIAEIASGLNIHSALSVFKVYELLPYSLIIGIAAGIVYFLFGKVRFLMYTPVPVLIGYFFLPYLLAFM